MLQSLKASFHDLRSVKVIAGVALFCALSMVLSSFTVYITPTLRISFNFLAVAASCYFYGFVPNILAGLITDFLGWVLMPTGPYFPGYALNAMIQAGIYALFFYSRGQVPLKNILAARALVVVINYLLLNPLWLSILYGQAYQVLASARIIKNLVEYPVDVLMLWAVLKLCAKIRRPHQLSQR